MRGLQLFVMLIPSLFHIEEASDKFLTTLRRHGWIINEQDIDFTNVGDSIDDRCQALLGVHCTAQSTVPPLTVLTPPVTEGCKPINEFIHKPFNDMTYVISFSRSSINQHSDSDLTAIDPIPAPPLRSQYMAKRLYDIIPKNDIGASTVGAGVYDTSHLFPPLSLDDKNIFGRLFGVEFDAHDVSLIRSIAPYEVVRGFGFCDETAQKLALKSNLHLLTGAVPVHSSHAVLSCISDRMRAPKEREL